jgi:hypothetical protein
MRRIFQLFFFCTLLSSANLYGQNKAGYEWYLTESNGGLCSQSLLLFKDSSYCSESGCEASSHFSFGKWTQKKNIIKFIPVDPNKYKFISKVDSSKTNDKNLTVIIYDNQGNNITSRITVGQYVKNAGVYNMDLDSSQTKRTGLKRTNSTIVLKSLQRMSKQKIEINIDSSNVYKIYLNISEQWNFHLNSDWDGTFIFSLIKNKNKLISPIPDQIDSKGNFKPSEYIRQ